MNFVEGVKASIGRWRAGGRGVALGASVRQQRHSDERQGEDSAERVECLKAGFHVYKIKPESHHAGSLIATNSVLVMHYGF
jgi:hypothetical protein